MRSGISATAGAALQRRGGLVRWRPTSFFITELLGMDEFPHRAVVYPGILAASPGDALEFLECGEEVFDEVARFEKMHVKASLDQAVFALGDEHCIPLAKHGRQIPTRVACTRNPRHGLNKQTVVRPTPPSIARLPKAIRGHLRPLGVTQCKTLHEKREVR
jgi:hypothetical protein